MLMRSKMQNGCAVELRPCKRGNLLEEAACKMTIYSDTSEAIKFYIFWVNLL